MLQPDLLAAVLPYLRLLPELSVKDVLQLPGV